MAATSLAVPSVEDMRSILCVLLSLDSGWLLILSCDSRLGAMGRAACATCSWVRRIAREGGMVSSESELELELESEDCISAASETKVGGTGSRNVAVGAEVEKRLGLG